MGAALVSVCEALAPTLEALHQRYGWRCRLLSGSDRVVLSTGRRRANSEPVRLYVRLASDSVIVSDGGETLSALADAGFDREDPVLDNLWAESLQTYRLEELDGRVVLTAPLNQAADTLHRLADGLVALDLLRVVALPARRRGHTLAEQVEGYLRGLYPTNLIERGPRVQGTGGLVIRPALRVDTKRGGVLVQPGAAGSPTQSYDHAYTLFAHVSRRTPVAMSNRLTVLGGRPGNWDVARLRALGDLTFVGFWADRDRVRRFLDGDIPKDTVMVPVGKNVPLFPAVGDDGQQCGAG